MSQNNFDAETRYLFLEGNQFECFGCGQNHANCLHHIFGRGISEGCEKSPLNASPLGNHQCHLPRHGHWCTDEGRGYLLGKTIKHLYSNGYQLTDLDNQFLEKYKFIIGRLKLNI